MKKSNLIAKGTAVVLAVTSMLSTATVAYAEDSTVTDKPIVELIIENEKDSKEIDQEYYDAMIEHHKLIAGTGNVSVAPADEMTISFELNVDASEIKSVDIYKHKFFYTDSNDELKLGAYSHDMGGLIRTTYEDGKCICTQMHNPPTVEDYAEPIDFLNSKNSFELDSNEWYTIHVIFQNNSGSIWWVVPEDYEYKEYSLDEMFDVSDDIINIGGVLYSPSGEGIVASSEDSFTEEEFRKFTFSNIKLVDKEDEETVNPSPDTETENYVADLTTGSTVVSATDFATILAENETKDVIIKTNNDVTFIFAKGTMKAVEGIESYDFTTTVSTTYKSDLPSYVTKDNFVSLIDYNYSGKLPAEASIKIPVGTEYAGKTLYYSLMNEDNTYAEVQTVVVDAEGYVTVKQDHCSTYVLTNTEPKLEDSTDSTEPATDTKEDMTTDVNEETSATEETTAVPSGTSTPDTGDSTATLVYLILAVSALGAILVTAKMKRA